MKSPLFFSFVAAMFLYGTFLLAAGTLYAAPGLISAVEITPAPFAPTVSLLPLPGPGVGDTTVELYMGKRPLYLGQLPPPVALEQLRVQGITPEKPAADPRSMTGTRAGLGVPTDAADPKSAGLTQTPADTLDKSVPQVTRWTYAPINPHKPQSGGVLYSTMKPHRYLYYTPNTGLALTDKVRFTEATETGGQRESVAAGAVWRLEAIAGIDGKTAGYRIVSGADRKRALFLHPTTHMPEVKPFAGAAVTDKASPRKAAPNDAAARRLWNFRSGPVKLAPAGDRVATKPRATSSPAKVNKN